LTHFRVPFEGLADPSNRPSRTPPGPLSGTGPDRDPAKPSKPAVLSPAYLNTLVTPNTAVKVRRDQSGSQVGPVWPKRENGVLDAFPDPQPDPGSPLPDPCPGPSWTPWIPPLQQVSTNGYALPGSHFGVRQTLQTDPEMCQNFDQSLIKILTHFRVPFEGLANPSNRPFRTPKMLTPFEGPAGRNLGS
jgi:hypothetical protein